MFSVLETCSRERHRSLTCCPLPLPDRATILRELQSKTRFRADIAKATSKMLWPSPLILPKKPKSSMRWGYSTHSRSNTTRCDTVPYEASQPGVIRNQDWPLQQSVVTNFVFHHHPARKYDVCERVHGWETIFCHEPQAIIYEEGGKCNRPMRLLIINVFGHVRAIIRMGCSSLTGTHGLMPACLSLTHALMMLVVLLSFAASIPDDASHASDYIGASGLYPQRVRDRLRDKCLLATIQNEGCVPHDGGARGHCWTVVSDIWHVIHETDDVQNILSRSVPHYLRPLMLRTPLFSSVPHFE